MEQKKTFKLILAALALMLILLPFLTTFNSSLTNLFDKVGWYKIIQDTIVPLESRLIVTIVGFLGIPGYLAPFGDKAAFYLQKGQGYLPVDLAWNCLGWQSLILLLLSLIVGLQGAFTKLSKLECILIGILGTFLVNIFRIVFVAVGVYYVNTVFAFLIHDYFAALTTIIWFLFFWWFAYGFVLEERAKV